MAKKQVIEVNLLDYEDIISENEVENLEVEDKNNIDIPNTDSYSYAVTIICKYWRQTDAINYLEFFIPSHLYYFLCVANDVSMINYKSCYDLNILEPDLQIRYKLNVKTEISIIRTDLWKSIHKKAFMGDKAKVNKDLNNGSTYNHSSNIITSLIKRLKLILTTKFTARSITSHLLDILTSNSNSQRVCNYIYLSLLLNE